ncbi:hypothetical protein STAS_03290 [Striga asiatica]|uniref:Uncharacterized protein n=1 Tax=Striga asiatica TaxID=4170 RepID=A0A5A7P502_STRAF|nr:hypothetical protein STAS_03290 [Striga asiatica]
MKPLRYEKIARLLASFYQARNMPAGHADDRRLRFSDDGFQVDDQGFESKGECDCFDIFEDDWPVKDDEDEDCRTFWETQGFLLQEILDQCNSSCEKLREQIKRNIDMAKDSNFCNCQDKLNLRGCMKCLRQAVFNQLCSKGFNAALCKSKWKRTHKIPGGTHEYIEVIASTKSRTKHGIFVVELGFRDEFKMGKACDEYNKLTEPLPEVYIGKTEHLNAVIRVVCDAAKESAREGKIHIGPWRKREFMEMKWSASSEGKFLCTSPDEQHLACVSSSRRGSSHAVKTSFEITNATPVKVA